MSLLWWQVTFFRDCRPEKMTRYPAATAEVSSGSGTPKDGSAVSHRKLGDDSSPAQNRVLRTVYLPSERADALLLTTQSLQQQLDDMRKLMDERTEVKQRVIIIAVCLQLSQGPLSSLVFRRGARTGRSVSKRTNENRMPMLRKLRR
jgi:hypothetical protein